MDQMDMKTSDRIMDVVKHQASTGKKDTGVLRGAITFSVRVGGLLYRQAKRFLSLQTIADRVAAYFRYTRYRRLLPASPGQPYFSLTCSQECHY